MDPLTIVTAAVSLTAGIAKASFAVSEFLRDAHDASRDLDSVCKELQALAAVVDPLTRSLTRARGASVLPDDLITQIGETLEGCDAVVDQIAANVRKYQRDKVWNKAKWALFGQGDMQKLRESLEAYKMALSLGFHAISMYGLLSKYLAAAPANKTSGTSAKASKKIPSFSASTPTLPRSIPTRYSP